MDIEKECNFSTISAEELLISKNTAAITDKKLRDKMVKKTLELKKTIDLIKQNTYEKTSKKNTKPVEVILAKERHTIKGEPKQRMEKFPQDQKSNREEIDHIDFVGHRTGHQYISVQL